MTVAILWCWFPDDELAHAIDGVDQEANVSTYCTPTWRQPARVEFADPPVYKRCQRCLAWRHERFGYGDIEHVVKVAAEDFDEEAPTREWATNTEVQP